MIRKVIPVICLCVVLLFLASCSKNKPGSQDEKVTIAVIPKGTTHEFWKSIHAGAAKAAKDLGIEIIWKGPLKEDDREEQIKTVESMITRRVSGIVLAPLDNTALRVPVRSAVLNNIPVVIFDSGLKSNDYVSFVATDNYLGGKKGGEYLAKLLNGKGRVIMLRYGEGSESTTQREQGFLDALAQYPGINVVSSNQYSGPTTETSMRASENLLAAFKTADGRLTIDAIFCPNESSTFGMLRVLQDSNLAGHVIFVGFDSSERLVEALANRQINGLVLQNPINMGYEGVKTMVRHLRGETVPKRIDTGSTLATPENMSSPEIKQLLQPEYKKWLNE